MKYKHEKLTFETLKTLVSNSDKVWIEKAYRMRDIYGKIHDWGTSECQVPKGGFYLLFRAKCDYRRSDGGDLIESGETLCYQLGKEFKIIVEAAFKYGLRTKEKEFRRLLGLGHYTDYLDLEQKHDHQD